MQAATTTTGRLDQLIPQFLVLDLGAACRYYQEKLGFSILFTYEGFYAGVGRDDVTIHLKHSDDADPAHAFKKQNEHLDVYIKTDDVDLLFREYQAKGVALLKQLESQPWGMREFAIEDLDGYILYFGQPVTGIAEDR